VTPVSVSVMLFTAQPIVRPTVGVANASFDIPGVLALIVCRKQACVVYSMASKFCSLGTIS